MRFKHPEFIVNTILPIIKRMILCKELTCPTLPPMKVYKTGENPESWSTDIIALISTREFPNKKILAKLVLEKLPWLRKGSRSYCPYYKWQVSDSGIITFYVLPR